MLIDRLRIVLRDHAEQLSTRPYVTMNADDCEAMLKSALSVLVSDSKELRHVYEGIKSHLPASDPSGNGFFEAVGQFHAMWKAMRTMADAKEIQKEVLKREWRV